MPSITASRKVWPCASNGGPVSTVSGACGSVAPASRTSRSSTSMCARGGSPSNTPWPADAGSGHGDSMTSRAAWSTVTSASRFIRSRSSAPITPSRTSRAAYVLIGSRADQYSVLLAIDIAVLAEHGVVPSDLRFAAEIQHVVVVGMAAHAHGDDFDQRRTETIARPLDGPRKGGGDRVGIGAVDGDAGDAVAGGLVGEHTHGRLLDDRRRQRPLVVLDAEHRRQPARGAEVDRFVPLAERRAALAHERHRHPAAALARKRHRHPGDRHRRDRERRRRRQDAPREVADVQILAVGGIAGFSHLRVQHHAHRRSVHPHGEHDAEIANRRSDDVTIPFAVRAAKRRAAAQAKRRGADRLLTERAESLALKRRVLVPDLAAREERLQPIVGGARQEHAAQQRAALVRCRARPRSPTGEESRRRRRAVRGPPVRASCRAGRAASVSGTPSGT